MNLKQKMKNFFTLTRKANDGFTLVELIVVIAILAILAGVAVPAYSGYVKKANMQTDRTLISEIEQALTLAYYAGDLTEGSAGFLLLDPAGEATMDSAGNTPAQYDLGGSFALAMEKTFGSNWMDSMELKYDNWGVSWNAMDYEDATALVNSNFAQKYTSGELMAQVQVITDAVNGLQMDATKKLVEMFDYGEDETGGNVIDDVIKEYYGNSKSWDDFNATEKSNLLVLATASGINKGNNASATTLIPQYALYAAYAAENSEFNEAYKTFQNTINNVNPNSADSEYTQIKNAYNTLTSAADKTGFKEWQNANGENHEAAFEAVMAGIGSAMNSNKDAILADLGNAEMFTSGIGSEMYNDYLNAAYVATGVLDDELSVGEAMSWAGNGIVVVGYTVTNGQIYIDNSLPNNS